MIYGMNAVEWLIFLAAFEAQCEGTEPWLRRGLEERRTISAIIGYGMYQWRARTIDLGPLLKALRL